MSYLKNAWTMAAWSTEVPAGKMLARTLLDERLVIFRDPQGQAQALRDRCPHRFAPLSTGHLRDGGASVECGYHGLRFGADGRCVLNPHGDGAIPKAAVVRRYPLVERWQALWIWMGDANQADPATIPDMPFMDPEHWAVGTGHMVVQAPYELEIDNLLDASHIEFMHPLLGSEAVRSAEVSAEQDGEVVWSKRFIRNDDDPPAFQRGNFQIPEGPVDRWVDVRWTAPANMAMWAGGVRSGRPTSEGVVIGAVHCFTPINPNSTYYFYAICFPRSLGPMADDMARESVPAIHGVFANEDGPMLEDVAKVMNGAEFWALKPVLLPSDAAAVRARRVLSKLIAQEQAPA